MNRRGRPIARKLSPGLQLAVTATGGTLTSLAGRLGVSAQAVSKWKRVPVAQVFAIEKLTRISRKRLRPDIFAVPPIDPS